MLSGLMPASQRDYYDVLGVGRSASADELKRAYRRLAMEYHPDRNRGADAAERFKEINRAYEVLSDGEKRAAYDRFGHAGVDATGGPAGFDGFAFEGFGDISRPRRRAGAPGSSCAAAAARARPASPPAAPAARAARPSASPARPRRRAR